MSLFHWTKARCWVRNENLRDYNVIASFECFSIFASNEGQIFFTDSIHNWTVRKTVAILCVFCKYRPDHFACLWSVRILLIVTYKHDWKNIEWETGMFSKRPPLHCLMVFQPFELLIPFNCFCHPLCVWLSWTDVPNIKWDKYDISTFWIAFAVVQSCGGEALKQILFLSPHKYMYHGIFPLWLGESSNKCRLGLNGNNELPVGVHVFEGDDFWDCCRPPRPCIRWTRMDGWW